MTASDEIELSIKYSDETEELGYEIWCSKKAAKMIASILNQRQKLEADNKRLREALELVLSGRTYELDTIREALAKGDE